MLIAYLVAGDPDAARSLALMRALVRGGVDAIELGYPHAEPALDGAAVTAANARALASGGSLDATFAQLSRFRKTDEQTPVIAMGYAAPLADHGWARFAGQFADAGGDGLIVADLRLRDARRALLPALADRGLVLIPLASPARAPADPVDDVPGIGGFFYAIPVAGSTGGKSPTPDAVADAVARARVDRSSRRGRLRHPHPGTRRRRGAAGGRGHRGQRAGGNRRGARGRRVRPGPPGGARARVPSGG